MGTCSIKGKQNSKFKLCGNGYAPVSHITCKCNNSDQKECKGMHEWVGKVIYQELCKPTVYAQIRYLFLKNKQQKST